MKLTGKNYSNVISENKKKNNISRTSTNMLKSQMFYRFLFGLNIFFMSAIFALSKNG